MQSRTEGSLTEALAAVQAGVFALQLEAESWPAQRRVLELEASAAKAENSRLQTVVSHLQLRIRMLEYALQQARAGVSDAPASQPVPAAARQRPAPAAASGATAAAAPATPPTEATQATEATEATEATHGIAATGSTAAAASTAATPSAPAASPTAEDEWDEWEQEEEEADAEDEWEQEERGAGMQRPSSDPVVRLDGKQQEEKHEEEEEEEGGEGLLAALGRSLGGADDAFLDELARPQPSWAPASTLRAHYDSVRGIAFHDSLPVLLSASDDCTVRLWSIRTDGKKTEADAFHAYYGHTAPVLACAMAPSRAQCFSGGLDGSLLQWRLPSLERAEAFASYGDGRHHLQRRLEGHSDGVWDLLVHKERLLCSASADGTVRLWDCFGSGEQAGQLATASVPTSLCSSAVERDMLFVGYADASVGAYDVETASLVRELRCQDAGRVNRVAAHPLVSLVFAAHEDRHIRFYDTKSGKCVHSMAAHVDGVAALAVDPSGRILLSGGHDSSLRFWDLATKSCVQELPASRKKYDESIHAVAFHPCLNFVACSGADSAVKLLRQRHAATVP